MGTVTDRVEHGAVPAARTASSATALASLVTAVAAGALLALTARAGAVELLVGVAVVQAAAAASVVLATTAPGRKGALVILAMASAGADVAVSVWPDSRLGTLLVVFALAVPVMFVHQLMRGAVRLRVVESLATISLGVVVVVSLAAYPQLRHEFDSSSSGGKVVSGVVAAAAAALVVGLLVDLVMPAPRFDPSVDRGLLALVASAGLGGSIGSLMLGSDIGFLSQRGVFVGAACGALAGLFALAVAFVLHSAEPTETRTASALRPVLTGVVPLTLVAPIAFVLCLAVRA